MSTDQVEVSALEKEMNDTRINTNGSLNVQQIFFVQRWMERLNTNTHSSYSIHFLNTHEAIKELIYVTNAVINNDIHGQQRQSAWRHRTSGGA